MNDDTMMCDEFVSIAALRDSRNSPLNVNNDVVQEAIRLDIGACSIETWHNCDWWML